MSTDTAMPTLHFFHATPADLLANHPLASSLQTFETCLFLISMHRFPSALVSCATACESAMKAKLRLGKDDKKKFHVLVNDTRTHFPSLPHSDSLRPFRDKRNAVVHFGFSPQDDEACAKHLLETGLPFISQLYRELFDFYLDWQEVHPGNKDVNCLTTDEWAKVGLLPQIAEHFRQALEIYDRGKKKESRSYGYCFRGLSHYIRLWMKESAMSKADWIADEIAESRGIKLDAVWEETDRIKARFGGETWEFDCPVCKGKESVVAELDRTKLNAATIATGRCTCAKCRFTVGKAEPYLSEVLLADQIEAKSADILREFGIEE